jgi:hypothetical protein
MAYAPATTASEARTDTGSCTDCGATSAADFVDRAAEWGAKIADVIAPFSTVLTAFVQAATVYKLVEG